MLPRVCPRGTVRGVIGQSGGTVLLKRLGVVALVIAVISLAAVDIAHRNGGSSTTVQSAAKVSGAGTTTVPPSHDPRFPTVPVSDHGAGNDLYGWGTNQPTEMQASVQYGGTNKILSPARRALLANQLVIVRKVALAIGTVANAEKLGFVKNYQRINGRGFEYVNWGWWSHKVDLLHPTVLAFDGDQPNSKVVSVAYNVLGSIQAGPPKTFPLEVIPWHYHSNLCEKNGTAGTQPAIDQVLHESLAHLDLCGLTEPSLRHIQHEQYARDHGENPELVDEFRKIAFRQRVVERLIPGI